MDKLFIHPITHKVVHIPDGGYREMNASTLIDEGFVPYELAFRTTAKGERPFLDKLKVDTRASVYRNKLQTAILIPD